MNSTQCLALVLPILAHSLSLLAADARQGARQLQQAFIAAAEKAGPAVVTIASQPISATGRQPFRPFLKNPEPGDIGSGLVIRADGLILTNDHVVSRGRQIWIYLPGGKGYQGKVLARDSRADLALIKVNAQGLKTIPIGDSDKVKVGQWAIALGNPYGLSLDARPSVTVGVVSGLHRSILGGDRPGRFYGDLIQTDAAINPGNSGGPLVDIDGNMIGINVVVFSTTGGYQGLSFSIPVNRAMQIAESLRLAGKVEYGWLGIRLGDIGELEARRNGRRGTLVDEILENTPASKSGLRVGDLIVAIEGRPVRTSEDLKLQVNAIPAGKKVILKILRGGKTLEVPVVLGKRPQMY